METAIKFLAYPSNILAVCLLFGAVLVWWRQSRVVGFVAIGIAAALYLVLGAGPVSFWLLGSLEYRYPELSEIDRFPDAKTIVVLAGHAERRSDVPLSSEVNHASALRIVEAVRLFRKRRGMSIVVSGESYVPVIMKELLVELGVPNNRIVVENVSSSTQESAANLKSSISQARFFLVTSAGHMPRAVFAFESLGMNPVPAPTDFLTRRNILATRYLPGPVHLGYSDLAVHEYLALFWYQLGDRL